MQLLFNQFLKVRLAEKILHDIQPFVNRLLILQRKDHPAFQQTCSHRADCPVDDIQQTASAIIHIANQLKATHRKLIQTNIFIFLNTSQRSDMSNLCMLRHRKVLQDSAGSYDTILQVFHAETFQVLRLKMLQQLLTGSSLRKYPVVKLEGKELAAEIPLKHQAFATLEKNLFRSEVVQQFVHIVKRAFRSKEFAGRYIEKGNATGSLSEMDGSQEVVLLIVQYIIIDGNTRSHQFGNPPFH